MYKKIIIGVLITLTLYAFPFRLLGLSDTQEIIVKVLIRALYCSIIFILLIRDNLAGKARLLLATRKPLLIKLMPAFLIMAAYILLNVKKFGYDFQGHAIILSLTLMATFLGAFAEEIFFRGYVFGLLRKEGCSTYKAVILSSLLFAGIHFANAFRYGDTWSVINQVCFAFLMGIMLCSIFALTKNLLIVSLYHFVINIPSALSSVIQVRKESQNVPIVTTFSEDLISTLVFILLLSPVIMVSDYYMKLVKKENI